LQVNGSFRLVDGSQGAGKVLTSDASGNATWQTPFASWIVSGNDQYSNVSGNVGVGTSSPAAKLTIKGSGADFFKIDYSNSQLVQDQSNTGNSFTFLSQPTAWQSFTPGLSGRLGRVAVDVAQGRQMSLKILDGEGSGGTELYQTTFLSVFGLSYINIGGNLNLTVGQKYTIYIADLTTDPNFGTQVGWATIVNNPYAGGMSSSTVSDAVFYTYMYADGPFVADQNGRLGIGTATPTANLDVNGTFKFRGGNPGAGKILTSNATGKASWENAMSLSSLSVSNLTTTNTTANTLTVRNGTFTDMQGGTASVGTNTGGGAMGYVLTFPTPFSGVPYLFVTAKTPSAATFTATVTSVTATNATVIINRESGVNNWTFSLDLEWFAFR
jgi:hypothetical protein